MSSQHTPAERALVALAERPLWLACDYPERPYDYDAVFGPKCRACRIAAQAMAARDPDEVVEFDSVPDRGEFVGTKAEFARQFYADEATP